MNKNLSLQNSENSYAVHRKSLEAGKRSCRLGALKSLQPQSIPEERVEQKIVSDYVSRTGYLA